jgi:zinc transporter 1
MHLALVLYDPNNPKHWTIYVDPTLSIIIVIIITISTVPLFKETSFILLQTVPNHIKVNDLKKQLLEEVPEVDDIHELHIWRLTGEKFIASAHVKRRSLADYMPVADKVKHFFHSMGIHSTTIQYEYDNDDKPILIVNDSNDNHAVSKSTGKCLLRCPNNACDTLTCCTKDLIRSDTVINTTNNGSDIQTSTTAPIEIRIQLADEHDHENDCDHEHSSHTHVSMNELSQNEKF